MGIIGYGRIGQSTGRIAQALGMRVLAYDSYQNPELVSDTCRYAALDELLECSDVIALHCPLFPETEKIINKDTIAKMKDGVIILNNSRGPLIEEQDLADALKSGKVAAAGLDVVSSEPIKEDNPLLQAPKLPDNAAYLMGSERIKAEADGYSSRKPAGIPCRNARACSK